MTPTIISTSVARIAESAVDGIPDVELGILTNAGWGFYDLDSEDARDLITALTFALERPDIASLQLHTSCILDERDGNPFQRVQRFHHCAACGRDLTDTDGTPGTTPCPEHGEADSIENAP